jgi:hypothetical protein
MSGVKVVTRARHVACIRLAVVVHYNVGDVGRYSVIVRGHDLEHIWRREYGRAPQRRSHTAAFGAAAGAGKQPTETHRATREARGIGLGGKLDPG